MITTFKLFQLLSRILFDNFEVLPSNLRDREKHAREYALQQGTRTSVPNCPVLASRSQDYRKDQSANGL
jgi:hypothetical protein